MRNHDFGADGFLALIAAALCWCARACSFSHLANLSRRPLTSRRPGD
jgi:hypothetical protein